MCPIGVWRGNGDVEIRFLVGIAAGAGAVEAGRFDGGEAGEPFDDIGNDLGLAAHARGLVTRHRWKFIGMGLTIRWFGVLGGH